MKRPASFLLFLATLSLVAIPPLHHAGAAEPTASREGSPPTIGLQLYSLREQFSKDVPGTMKLIKSWGITDVEAAGFYNLTAEQFKQELDKAGLKASGSHVQYPVFFQGTDKIIQETKAIGAHYVIIPWIPHKDSKKFTLEEGRTAAANFNKWGQALKDAGLQLGYHPHGYEFTDAGNGKTVFDVMMEETKPDLVTYELDVFWAFHGGADPVKLLQKYPDRFTLLHLKDMKKGTKVPQTTGQEAKTADVTIGTGQLDFPAIMREAKKIGAKHYYIEDESPTVANQVPQSLKYLRSLEK